MFGEAYSLSYADIYDFATKKQSLKKWMIDLRIHKQEMDIPWDQPVPPERVADVVEYCVNDVKGTKATLRACETDLLARKILAQMSGLTVNDTTRNHAARIIFGRDRRENIADELMYTDLSEMFPGYTFDPYAQTETTEYEDEPDKLLGVRGKSTYRGEEVGEGGYVYAEPGMYSNVALLDVASMHPTSIVELELFGAYTQKFANLMKGRLAIKRKDIEAAKEYIQLPADFVLTDKSLAALADALKLVINSIYGYTSAKFDNPFRDPRNKDNIVAKRGALFMVDLKHFIQERGFQVVHIKTDSVKIPDATPEIIAEVMEFGKRYGYTFEHEKTLDKFCLVNDAVYIAKANGKWEATGKQFAHPVVFKALFSGEPIRFDDLCETKQVTSPSSMWLDFGSEAATPAEPNKGMHFVGRTGRFLPVYSEYGGGDLVRVKDGKHYAVAGTKGYKWLESEMVREMEHEAVERLLFEDLLLGTPGGLTEIINMGYYEDLVEDAVQTINKFGDYNEFVK